MTIAIKPKWVRDFSGYLLARKVTNSSLPFSADAYRRADEKNRQANRAEMDATFSLIQENCVSVC
jgi:hypothetical protein